MTLALDTPVRWKLAVDASIQSRYEADDAPLQRLYQKGKEQQWSIDDIDWHHTLTHDNPLQLPDQTLLIYGTDLWRGFSVARQAETRRHFQAWTLSQILHGEQAALLCAAKLVQGESGASARMCASAQVFDEARHVEAYARLLNDKIGLRYPLSGTLAVLLEQTITSSDLDITNLGMQILVEGLALAIFQSITAYGADPFVKDLISRIQRDEARHFAVGRLTLSSVYAELSSHELSHREDFLCEGIQTLYDHLCADDIWVPLGHDQAACGGLVRASPMADALRRGLFRRLVPTIKAIGLLRGPVIELLRSMRMLDYADWPLADAA